MSYSIKYQNGGVMNEHYKKGEEALALKDFKTAIDEFKLANCDSSPFIQKMVERRLKEIKDLKLSESKTGKNPQIKTTLDRPKIGWLSYLGYHVGEKEGIPKKERRDILKKAFYQTISIRETQFTEKQVKWWGQAGSQERFQKLCSRLSTLGGKDETVNDDRKDDLLWLLSEFKKEVFPEKSPE